MRDVVITGASSGIGRAVAEAFAPRRVRLFLVARRRELLQEVADRCLALGAEEVRFSPHDLSRPGEGTALIEEVLAAWGNIDLLICNAGYGYWGPMEELDPAAMRRMMEVNFHSVYESVYAVLPHMKGKGRGHLVFVGSVIGRRGMPFSAGYSA
ncbi:MAG TPA: SDR family NAD(P)-dependent oxidoreductase, partial [Acidobacteriota bacterium]|nr:SDR family NAD(P)-dependent oxidoreductase [Acidobacteriota bacterium]